MLALREGELPERLAREVEDPFHSWFYLERVRFTDGVPSQHLKTWVPRDRFPDIESYDFEVSSLYSTLFELYGVRPDLARRTVRATGADAATAQILNVPEGTPIAQMDNIVYDEDGVLMEVGLEDYLGDSCSFSFEVRND